MRRAYAKRRDENEPEIVRALERRGILVQRLDPPVPDLLVGYDGVLYLMEVKDPAKDKRYGKRSNRNLTPSQVVWHAKWRGYAHIVETVDDALRVLGVV